MSLAVPSALALAALAIPIIVFYILKIRLRRIEVSTNLFWKQIYDEKPPRSIWQYFRHLLSLLAQLLLLTLMVLAVADPILSWQARRARRTVIVIDNSASMQAVDVDSSRFEAAVKAAVNLVEGMRFGDKTAIVLANDGADVVLGMTDHVPTLKRTLRDLVVSDNPTNLEDAIKLGQQLIGELPNGEVVVFSDGCSMEVENETDKSDPSTVFESKESDDSITSKPKISYRIFGTEAGNVGITQFQVRRSLIDRLGYEVLVEVKNASKRPVKCRLEIELADSPVDVLPLTLEPNETWSRALEKTSLEGGLLTASLVNIAFDDESKPDSESESINSASTPTQNKLQDEGLNYLSVDDRAWAVLPPQIVQPVLIVSPGNLFLRKVFEANPLVRLEVTREIPETWPSGALIVLHNIVPEKLPQGDIFVVDPLGSCDAWELGEVLANPIVTEVDSKSDLMTHVRLDNVLMPESRQLKFKNPPRVLAGALSGDPVYAELQRATGKGLMLTVNLDKSDLTFRTAFPIMLTNALNWFADSTGELRESMSTGNLGSFELNAESRKSGAQLMLISPDGNNTKLGLSDSESEAKISLGPFEKVGVWKLSSQSLSDEASSGAERTDVAEFAVNLANSRETDLRTPKPLLELDNQPSAIANWFVRPIWYYLVAVAGALFVVEWFLYQRRHIS